MPLLSYHNRAAGSRLRAAGRTRSSVKVVSLTCRRILNLSAVTPLMHQPCSNLLLSIRTKSVDPLSSSIMTVGIRLDSNSFEPSKQTFASVNISVYLVGCPAQLVIVTLLPESIHIITDGMIMCSCAAGLKMKKMIIRMKMYSKGALTALSDEILKKVICFIYIYILILYVSALTGVDRSYVSNNSL